MELTHTTALTRVQIPCSARHSIFSSSAEFFAAELNTLSMSDPQQQIYDDLKESSSRRGSGLGFSGGGGGGGGGGRGDYGGGASEYGGSRDNSSYNNVPPPAAPAAGNL